MEYYTKRRKRKYLILFISILAIIIISNTFLILFDKQVFPYIIEVSEIYAKTEMSNIINEESVKALGGDCSYKELVNIEKNSEGKVVLVQMNTSKLNYLSSKMSLACNERLKSMQEEKIKVPMGWITGKSMFYTLMPSMSMELEPVGNIVITYDSSFESAGINQTRHKIYLNVSGKEKIKLPLHTKDIDINMQIPVCETIIIGDIPNNSFYPLENKSNK